MECMCLFPKGMIELCMDSKAKYDKMIFNGFSYGKGWGMS